MDRAKLARIADGLVVALAVALPWSTSGTSILAGLWLLAVIPSLNWNDVRRELMTPAGGLPVLLFFLGLLGMAWADVSLIDRWKGLDGFIKLLVIPLLIAQFRRSEDGMCVPVAFLIACIGLLIASVAVKVWPELPKGSTDVGVIVKSYIVQSAEFVICAAVLLHLAVEGARGRRWRHCVGALVLAGCFLADIFFIATSRTSLVVMPCLVLLYGAWRFRWKGIMVAAVGCAVILVAAWFSSGYLRDRVNGVWSESEQYQAENMRTPSGERIMFWTDALGIVAGAPVIGHGTGSITEMFRQAAAGRSGVRAEVSSNPHNQTFAVAIQLGLIGAVVLWAMWLAHTLVFRAVGLTEWIGLVLVAQNVVGSLFNSYLFDFTEGWLYVIGVGVAAGTVRRSADAAKARAS
jgi:hypothetical protein